MLLLSLRLAAYSVLPHAHNPWVVLPVELLHGEVTFSQSQNGALTS